MNVTITLDSGLGANLGPNFNLTANVGGIVTPSTATRVELLAGKLVSVSDTSNIIFVTSTGVCTNTLFINIAGITTSTTTSTTSTSTTSTSTTAAPTTTSTSTSTTTTVAPILFIMTYDASVGGQACANFANNVGKITYYTPGITPLADGVGLFVDSNCTTFVDDGYYSDGTNWWYISGGTLSTQTACSVEWYTLTKCFGSGTITTKAYPSDTFNVNDRVHIGTAPNQTYYTITTVHTSDPGGSHTSPISDSTTSCPSTVDYTISSDCPYPLGKVTVNGLSGGLGTYQITTNLYSTSVAALAATVWESITTTKDYTSVSDGTYYVAVRDAGDIENIISKSVVVACTTTTTTSTSTSTTSTSTSTSTTSTSTTTSTSSTSTSTSTTTAAPTSTSTTSTTTQPGDTTTTTTSTTAAPTSTTTIPLPPGETSTTTTTTEPPTTTTTTEPPTTTTSTTTSTSTTTTTTTTLPPGTYYVVQLCSGGSPSGTTYIMNATDITPNVGSYYKLYAPTVLGSMDGVNCWYIVSTSTSTPDGDGTFGTGYINCTCGGTTTSTTTTSTSTTTLAPVTMYWDLTAGNGGTGTLSVRNGSNVEIFSTSTTAGVTSGTFVTNAGQLPLTVIGAWAGGSGNKVRYRICDSTPSEIYASPDIDVAMGSDTYVLSPTPTTFHVYLSSGPSTYPVNCDGSSGAPTTTTTTTTTAAPTCNHVLVNVGSPDRAASDDGKVYFYFSDCSGDSFNINYNTNKSHFDSGYCVNTAYPYGCYILVGSVQTPCTSSSLELGSICI